MKKSQFFALFNGLLKTTLMAVMLCFIVQFDALSYTFNWMCPNDTVVNLDNYKSLHTTTITGAIPEISGQNGKCTTTNIGGSDGGVGALKYWVCLYGNSLPSDSITQEPTIVNISGYVFEANKTYSSTLTNNSVVWCTPALIVHGMDTSNIFIDTKWYPLNANLPNITRFYTICNINQLPSGSTPGTIQNCNSRTYVINTQKNTFGTSGDTFWFIKHNAALSNVLTANDNYALIDKLDGWGGNTNLQYFYTRQSEIDEKAYGYEVDFKCSENSTDPFARIVLAGCSNNLNIESLSSDLKTAISTKAQNACGSALLNNSNLWCTGFMNNSKNTNCSDNGTSGYTTITSSSSIYFPQGGTCYFRSPYQITLNKQNGSNGTNYVYEKYSDGYYTDANATSTNKMTATTNNITIPTRSGYVFGGYYTSTDGNGTQYINETGYITSNASNTYFTAAGTLYAKWLVNCDAGTYLPAGSTTCARCPQHSYCEGGSFTQSTSSDQGIKSCSTETSGKFPRTYSCYESNSYGNCIKGASSISQCHASVSFQANADNVTFGGNSFEYKNVSVFYREDASVYAQTCAATQAGAGSDTYWCYRTNNNFYITTTPNIQRTGYNLNGWKKCTYNESGPTNCSSTNITTSAANSTSPYGPANANATLFNSSDLQNGILYLYADWEPIVYTITLNKYNGTGGTNGPIYEHYGVGFYDNPSLTGTAITSITPPERSGYNFKGYYYSGFENDGSGHFTITDDLVSIPNTGDLTNRETLFSTNTTLYARWIKSCAGSEHSSCNLQCEEGYDIGDEIDCYYITSCDSGYLMTSGGGTYNPQCELATCNVTNGTGVPTISYDTNKVTCAVTCNSGYSQDGTSGGATNFSVTGNANVAVVNANCNAIDYPITYDSDGQNLPAGVTNPPTYTAADNVQLNNPIKDGYGFAGWCRYDSVQQTGGDSCTITDTNYVQPQTNPATIIAIAAGSTGAKWFYSKWGAVNYNVIYDCGTDATGTPPPTTLQTFGTTFTVANTDGANCSKTGHHFTGWACKYLDGTDGAPNTGLTNNTTYNVAVDAQCTATWDVNTIYLDWNNDNGITGTNGAPSCQYGGTINPVQTVSKNGYNFVGWDVVNEPGRGIIEDKQ